MNLSGYSELCIRHLNWSISKRYGVSFVEKLLVRWRQWMYEMASLNVHVCHTKFDMLPALVLYIYAKFYMLDFNVYCIIICVWCAEVLSCFTNIISCYINFNMRIIGVLYVKSSACCIATHLCYTIISISVALSALIFVASTQIYVVSTQQINFAFEFVNGSTFSITP